MSSRGQVKRIKRLSRSARAGLVFPVSRISRYLKTQYCRNRRVGVAAPVYIGAVLEYLVAEVLELAGNAARDNKRRLVSPRHLLLAIASDTELSQLIKGVIISQGGVLPHIHEELLHRKKDLVNASKKQKPIGSPKPAASKKQKPIGSPKPAAPLKARRPVKKPARGRKAPVATAAATVTARGGGGGGAFTILSEKLLPGGQKLTVVKGDISTIKCDAVVHPTNSSLSLSGQCGNALSLAGGVGFRNEVQRASSHSLSVGEATISGSGSLPCSHVIHVHSPSWGASDALNQLEKSVQSCLNIAEEKKLKSVGFPSIASGSNNFPKQTSAQTILRCIRDYYFAFAGSVKQVYFVLYDMESIGIYTSELARLDL